MNGTYGMFGARPLARVSAVIMILVFAFCAFGCAGGRNGKTDERFGLSEAQYAELMRLSCAFRVFGEYDLTLGVELDKLEYMVFCYYSPQLTETDEGGFGTVPAEEADDMLDRVFGIKMMDVLRRSYDSEQEQTYYYKNGAYKVMRTDDSAYAYRITSLEKTADSGGEKYTVNVLVLKDGAEQLELQFTLTPMDEAFRVNACGVKMWY